MVNIKLCEKCPHYIPAITWRCTLLYSERIKGKYRNSTLGLPPDKCPYWLEQLMSMPVENVAAMIVKPGEDPDFEAAKKIKEYT